MLEDTKLLLKKPASMDTATKDNKNNTELIEYNAKLKTWTLKDKKAYGTILLYLNTTIQAM